MRLLHDLAVLFQVRDEFAQVRGGEILARHDHGRRVGGRPDGFKVAQRVVLDVRRQHGRRHMRAHRGGEQRVAVRRRGGDARRADRAARAADILDHHGLAEHLAHVLGDDARDDVARAAGREGGHHRDRARRIGPRLLERRHDGQQDGERCRRRPAEDAVVERVHRQPVEPRARVDESHAFPLCRFAV
jgi:hypothetical protein